MATEQQYYIIAFGKRVEVSEEMFLAYFRSRRRDRTLRERDRYNGLVSYNSLDSDETSGEDMVPDRDALSAEELLLDKYLFEELRQCISQLPEEDQKIIIDLYYEEKTQCECAEALGISQAAVSKRLHKILDKLRSLMK